MVDRDELAVIRRFNAAGHDEDDSALEELLTPDFVAHNGDQDVHGVDGWREFLARARDQFGPSRAGIDELIPSGNLIGERWWIRSTPPGTTTVSLAHGITMHRLVHGRIAEQWAVMREDD